MSKENKKKSMTEEERLRLERKKRIAQAKRKRDSYNFRQKEQVKRVERIVGISVAAILAIVICVFFLFYFGVINRTFTACKVGDTRVSVAEYQCAYMTIENNVYQQSQEYAQSYGSGYFDNETDLTDTCALDSEKTWAEYFQTQAYSMIEQVVLYRDKEGNELTKQQKKEINEQIESLEESASQNKYSLNAYIKNAYGTGVNEKVLRTWMEDIDRAANAQTYMQDKYKNGLSDSEIKDHYSKNSASYDSANAVYYAVNVDIDDKTKEELSSLGDKESKDKLIKKSKARAQKEAKAILAKIKANKTKANFVKQVNAAYKKEQLAEGTKESEIDKIEESNITINGTLSSTASYPSALTKWVYDKSRKAGDLDIVWNADYDNNTFSYILVYEIKAPAPAKTVSVRHILVKPEGLDSSAATDETWADAKKKAKELLAQWKKGDATEDSFGELATANTEDTGSVSTGGLYENVAPGEMVTEFNDWIFDSSRKKGDTDIVKTDYGYHIMYFVGSTGYNWQSKGSDDMASEYLSKVDTELRNKNKLVGKYCMRWASCYKDYAASLKKDKEQADKNSSKEADSDDHEGHDHE